MINSKINGRKSSNFIFGLIYILTMIIPLHYYTCELFLAEFQLDNIIRDIIIVFVFVLICKNNIRVNVTGKILIVNIVIMAVLAINSMADRNFLYGKINMLRTYLIPCLMFFICYNYRFTQEQLLKIFRCIVIEHAIIGIYGAFASFILGDSFLVNLGYPSEGGHLIGSSYYINGFYGFPRNTGTYVSPNTCGVMLAIAICVYLYSSVQKEIKHKNIVFFFLITGIITTVSRSATLGLVLGVFFATFISGKKFRISMKQMKKISCIVLLGLIGLVLINYFVLDNLLFRMLKFSFGSMLNGEDASAAKHLEDLYMPLVEVLKNPMGFGFGNNGPMALEYNVKAHHVESSIYLMMHELGIIGGLLYFVPYFLVIRDTWKNRKRYKFYAPGTVAVACMFTYLLLPNVQTFELLFFFFSLLGMYYNPSVFQLYETAGNE